MINEARFKKILNILKTNSQDLNTEIKLIDYDTDKACDYEVLTLHFKETNKYNDTAIYKDLVIRSQLYYDPSTELYYSALDGDIIVYDGALCSLEILTETSNLNLSLENLKTIEIKAQLLDVDTKNPLKNQRIILYATSDPNVPISSAKTDESGIAIFNFAINQENITSGENVLYMNYPGNNIYRATRSDYILINVDALSDLDNDVTALIDSSGQLHIDYQVSSNNQSLTETYHQLSDNSVTDEELLSGDVLFYLNDKIVAQSTLSSGVNSNTSNAVVDFPSELYNQSCEVSAVFTGNKYFSSQKASTTLLIPRVNIDSDHIRFDVLKTTNQDVYKIKLEFDIPEQYIDESVIFDKEYGMLYPLRGRALFYIKNSNGQYGTLIGKKSFMETSDFVMESQTENENQYYTITAGIADKIVEINRADYGLSLNDDIDVLAVYTGNTVIKGFSINKIASDNNV